MAEEKRGRSSPSGGRKSRPVWVDIATQLTEWINGPLTEWIINMLPRHWVARMAKGDASTLQSILFVLSIGVAHLTPNTNIGDVVDDIRQRLVKTIPEALRRRMETGSATGAAEEAARPKADPIKARRKLLQFLAGLLPEVRRGFLDEYEAMSPDAREMVNELVMDLTTAQLKRLMQDPAGFFRLIVLRWQLANLGVKEKEKVASVDTEAHLAPNQRVAKRLLRLTAKTRSGLVAWLSDLPENLQGKANEMLSELTEQEFRKFARLPNKRKAEMLDIFVFPSNLIARALESFKPWRHRPAEAFAEARRRFRKARKRVRAWWAKRTAERTASRKRRKKMRPLKRLARFLHKKNNPEPGA